MSVKKTIRNFLSESRTTTGTSFRRNRGRPQTKMRPSGQEPASSRRVRPRKQAGGAHGRGSVEDQHAAYEKQRAEIVAARKRGERHPLDPGSQIKLSNDHTEYEGPSLAEQLRYIKETMEKKHVAGSKKKMGTTPKKKLVKTTKGKSDVFGQMGLPKLPELPSVRR